MAVGVKHIVVDEGQCGPVCRGMTLDQYIKSENTTYAKFAGLVGHDAKTIYRYARGERMPQPEIMTKIYITTKGRVRPDDFHELPDLF